MSNEMIVLDHVSKSFNMYNSPSDHLWEALSPVKCVRHTEFYALKDISFSVGKGEIIGMMGRNGAGKSTLLKVISGILEPTKGSVCVNGRISSLLELGTGFNMEYTGIQNIFFYGTLMGFSKKEMDKKLSDIIAFAEVGDYIDQPVKTYSSGMFARLAFSCAIHIEPEILIVDEILSVGDMRFQAKCFKKFREFQAQGVTILYVGHDVGLMRTFCNRCIWLDSGEIVAEGDPTFITAQYTEYMYSDNVTDFTTYKKFKAEKEKAEKIKDEKVQTPQDVCEPVPADLVSEKAAADEEVKPQRISVAPVIHEDSIFSECLAHWGSHVGLVQSVRMLNAKGEEGSYFSPYERIRIEIFFRWLADIAPDNLSVAISIKNKDGTDLCVKTTFDEKIEIPAGDAHCVCFDFEPMLASGEYYLVVALENRENLTPVYFEYIEGAKFFKLYDDKKIYGVYDVYADILVDGEMMMKEGVAHGNKL